MPVSVNQHLKLLRLILQHGNMKHSGHDFNVARKQTLSALTDETPGEHYTTQRPGYIKRIRSLFWKKPFFRRIISELAYVISSYRKKGAHLYIPELNLAYIRIPKAASTSIGYALMNVLRPDIARQKLSSTEINFLMDHYIAATISPTDKYGQYFTVVRNPFARLVSVYRDFFERSESNFLYEDYLFGILKRNMSFEDFVTCISTIPDRLKDQHVRPLHMFLSYYQRHGIHPTIIRLEDPVLLNQFLTRHKLAIHHLNKNPESYDFRTYYNQRTLKIAFSICEKDIQQFGYELDYNNLQQFIRSRTVG